MKRLLAFLILLASCTPKDKLGPAKATTFVRYFNGGSEDDAHAVIESPDGRLVIMANTTYQASEQSAIHFRIKLIKTDAFGNQEWQRFYPDFDTQPYTKSLRGFGII